MDNSVLLGMSGGVDSTAAAIMLKKNGYRVVGATYILTDDSSFKKSLEDAKKAAKIIGIEHLTLDYRNDFKENVIDYFIKEYTLGRTPNPCVVCNKKIKLEKFIETADKYGISYIASGQYADIKFENSEFYILKPANKEKDQTYFLYNLNQNIIRRTLFPLGKIVSKEETRNIVKEAGIEIYNKKESQEICFIKNIKYTDYIKNYVINVEKGYFLDKNGNVLGKHNGIINYTIGQRKGLGIALGKPAYVIDINPDSNTIVIGDNEDLFKDSLSVYNYNFINNNININNKSLTAKIRYAAKEEKVFLKEQNNSIHVKFKNPVRAITKGQSIVFYDGDNLVGGGIIEY